MNYNLHITSKFLLFNVYNDVANYSSLRHVFMFSVVLVHFRINYWFAVFLRGYIHFSHVNWCNLSWEMLDGGFSNVIRGHNHSITVSYLRANS